MRLARVFILAGLVLLAVSLAACGTGRAQHVRYGHVRHERDAYGFYGRHPPVHVIGRPDPGPEIDDDEPIAVPRQ